MATLDPARPQADTGLPPGVHLGPLGARIGAYLIDVVPVAVVGAGLNFLLPTQTGTSRLVLSVVALVLVVAWAAFCCLRLTGRAATPGMQITGLQLVGFTDGRPLPLGRVLLRGVVWWLVSLTGIGWVIMIILLLFHPRKQGWHDLVADAVAIGHRALAPATAGGAPAAAEASAPSAATPAPAASLATALTPPPAPAAPAPLPLQPPAGVPIPTAGASTPFPVIAPATGAAPSGPSPYAPPAPAPSPAEGPWILTLDDGRELIVDGLILLGRNPQPQPGEEDAQLIKLADQTRTVSKSHLAVRADTRGLFVEDRGSTNGSTVTTPAGNSTRCTAFRPVFAAPGAIVSLGDHWLRVSRRSA